MNSLLPVAAPPAPLSFPSHPPPRIPNSSPLPHSPYRFLPSSSPISPPQYPSLPTGSPLHTPQYLICPCPCPCGCGAIAFCAKNKLDRLCPPVRLSAVLLLGIPCPPGARCCPSPADPVGCSVHGSRHETGTTPRFWFWSSQSDQPSSYWLWR